MATQLNSLIVRESTEIIDERNILVALTEDQRISFRLKGMKSGVVSIPIKELYETLMLGTQLKAKPISIKRTVVSSDEPMISLNRLRSLNATTPGSIEALAKLDSIIVELLEEAQSKKV